MVISIFGENCSGKSTLATRIRDEIGSQIITGKDDLRMARTEAEALWFIVNRQLAPSVLARSAFCERAIENAVRLLVCRYGILPGSEKGMMTCGFGNTKAAASGNE